ncbi:MAG TPA: hypothetical protein PLZ15_14735 [Melioribacteraceae bacterium]|nr:hypothetical protein [Melioribacteraceae bacterium]
MKSNTKLVHIDPVTHGKLKKYVLNLQLKGIRTTVSIEANTAILNHISKLLNEK